MPSRLRAIVADDNASFLAALCRVLEPHCDVVALAADGEDLLRQVREERPDVVVTDIAMPRMSGLDACRHIRRRFPTISVIVVSELLDEDFIAAAFECGATAAIRKIEMAEDLPAAVLALA